MSTMKNRFLILKLIVLCTVFGSSFATKADDLNPYLDATEHKISEREYDDLRSYIERAQKILTATLGDSTAFSGTELRSHLLSGIQTALQSTNLRHELLLFRYVLSRALEIDAFYYKNYATAQGAQLSAQVILLPSIESALSYYQSSDRPRLETTTVPSPDWLSFAADQVPQLLRAVDLAPSPDKKIEIVKRALGWTAKALNSAHERRGSEVADHIVRLGELYNYPNPAHPQYVTRAQDALLLVYKTYRKPIPTISLAPASSGTDLKMRRRSLFKRATVKILGLPIIGINTGGLLGRDKQDTSEDHQWEDSNFLTRQDLLRATLVLGGGKSATYDGNEAGTAYIKNAAVFRVDGVYINGSKAKSEYEVPIWGAIYGEVSGHVRPGDKASEWTYSARAAVSANVLSGVGTYIAVEKNKFERFSESFFRVGFAPQMMIRIGKMEYVVFRAMFGYANGGCDIEGGDGTTPCSRDLSGMMTGVGVVINKKRFSATLDSTLDTNRRENPGWTGGNDGNPEYVWNSRRAVDAVVTLPLGLVLRNDALILKGQAVDYTSGGGPSSASGLIFYGLKW